MTLLIAGLIVFLGVHSVRIVAEPWRVQQIARLGENGWKGLYSLLAAVGLALIIFGYGAARAQPVFLWQPPTAMRHIAALLTLLALILLAAAYVPRNHFKARLHHPMVLSVKTWAFAHLLANQMLADVLLFGGFVVWAVFSYRAAKARDRAAGTTYPAGTLAGTLGAVIVGTAVWALFAFWAHGFLFGVKPFARALG